MVGLSIFLLFHVQNIGIIITIIIPFHSFIEIILIVSRLLLLLLLLVGLLLFSYWYGYLFI